MPVTDQDRIDFLEYWPSLSCDASDTRSAEIAQSLQVQATRNAPQTNPSTGGA